MREPTDLPEGKLVELVPVDELLARGGDELDDEERAALHRSIEEGFEEFEKGDVEDAFEFLRRLKSAREDRDRPASSSQVERASSWWHENAEYPALFDQDLKEPCFGCSGPRMQGRLTQR
ncbi:MAG TPA: hypothetical protein VFS67_04525 [Polyangiaceae bacterium]|nr:hypothetical protein [Polyangiaceae bacterium]